MFPPLILTFLCAWAITDVVEKRGKLFLLKNLSRDGLHRTHDSATSAVRADDALSKSSIAAVMNTSSRANKVENGNVKVKASDNEDPIV